MHRTIVACLSDESPRFIRYDDRRSYWSVRRGCCAASRGCPSATTRLIPFLAMWRAGRQGTLTGSSVSFGLFPRGRVPYINSQQRLGSHHRTAILWSLCLVRSFPVLSRCWERPVSRHWQCCCSFVNCNPSTCL